MIKSLWKKLENNQKLVRVERTFGPVIKVFGRVDATLGQNSGFFFYSRGRVPGSARPIAVPVFIVYMVPSQAAACDSPRGTNINVPAVIPARNASLFACFIFIVSPRFSVCSK